MASFAMKDGPPCRLRLASAGPHRFGGPPAHRGVTPRGTRTALHLLLLLDVADPSCPVQSERVVRYLPLYYPLKFGVGGATVQYAVTSDDEVEILHLSDVAPDPVDEQYVRVPELPSSPAQIVPLRYEEARILSFAGGYFQPNAEDRALLDELNREHDLILLGGRRQLPVNAGDVICRNRGCEFFGRRVWLDVIASLPPVPVRGSDAFWHEYQGCHVEFYFGLCRYCRTVIAFNVAA
jgi:hypothetical protein